MNFSDVKYRSRWARHRKQWTPCNACGLGECATEHVFARGDLPADILFVGEAPGETEDIVGQPFKGKAGIILDTMLRDVRVNLRREFSYAITNILCCRPTDDAGDNRPPTKDEAAACSPRLQQFIKLCCPVAVVTLGKVPSRFFPEKSLPRLEVTHPSYWLRTGHTHGYPYKKAKVDLTKFLREHA